MPAGVAAQVAQTMTRLEKAVTSRSPLFKTINASKKMLEAEGRKDMGSDLALSNWRRGRPVRVRIRDNWVDRAGVNEQASMITPRPIGPMVVMTHGRKPGVSNRRKSRGRRYPGSRGKGTWTRGRDRVYREAPRIFKQHQVRDVVSAFTRGLM